MLIRNATLPDGRTRDVLIEGETVAAVGEDLPMPEGADERFIDASDKRLTPGMIDAHVHFREPGFPHKETWETGSRAAAAGGVTTVVDQPNTDPPTTDGEAFDRKDEEFASDSIVDYGLNGGVTEDWTPSELLQRPIFALGEVFLADSTGDMGIDGDLFASAVKTATRQDTVVTVHAEDATQFEPGAKDRDDADAWSAYRTARAEVSAAETAAEVADHLDARVHLAHTSTPDAIDVAAEHGMTCEVTPHHMFLSRKHLDDLGTHGRMNPPLRRERLRSKVWERVVDGTVDVVATDHAPHTKDEKDAVVWDAPSGVPGVETALPLLLERARRDEISYERIRDLTAANVAEIFDLPTKGRIEAGMDADLVLFDSEDTQEIEAEELQTECGWTPFEGHQAVFPELTLVRGQVAYERLRPDAEHLEPETGEMESPRFGDPVGTNVRTIDRSGGGDAESGVADESVEVVDDDRTGNAETRDASEGPDAPAEAPDGGD